MHLTYLRALKHLRDRVSIIMRAPPPDVHDYLAKAPPAHRAALEKLRKQILAVAPDATERISYGMPGFVHEGMLVWMASFRDHCSFFPGTTGVKLALANGFTPKDASKGTIRFAAKKPIPAALVKRIVKMRVAENEARAEAKRAAAAKKKRRAPKKAR